MTYDRHVPYWYFVKVLVCRRIKFVLLCLRRACARISCKGFGARPKRSLIPAQAIFETPDRYYVAEPVIRYVVFIELILILC